jgi:hypothetical protein
MRVLLAFSLALLIGCNASKHGGSSGGAGTGGGGEAGAGGTTGSGGTTTDTNGGAGAGVGGFGGGMGGGGTGGLPAGETEVFGQSPDTLYKLDPVTKEVTAVGAFGGCPTVIDIALDKDANMLGTTTDGLYAIDKKTAKCTLIAQGSYPNSLSFVPAGTLDANVEALVGYEGSDYVRIDPKSGQKTVVKAGALGDYVSSGDVVSVINGGTYLTVNGGPEFCGDCILQVDPKTGGVIKNIGKLTHGGVYGLAFWGGSAYGFDAGGQLFQINLTNAQCTNIAQPNAPPGLVYYGAGSSTSAPLEPPK